MNPANNNSRASGPAPTAGTLGAAKVAEGAVGAGTISLARLDRLRNSMPGKDSLLDELIDLFVSDLPKRLNAIALALQCADAAGKMNLALQAHALRGSAAIFGASRLDELCGKLEEIGVSGALAEAPALLDKVGRESARVRDALLELKSKHLGTPAGASSTSRR